MTDPSREKRAPYTHTVGERTWRLYGCAKRGCDRVNPDYLSFKAGGKGYCLHHIPLRARVRMVLASRTEGGS